MFQKILNWPLDELGLLSQPSSDVGDSHIGTECTEIPMIYTLEKKLSNTWKFCRVNFKLKNFNVYVPVHQISVLTCMAYVQMLHINTHADISSKFRRPKVESESSYTRQHPYFWMWTAKALASAQICQSLRWCGIKSCWLSHISDPCSIQTLNKASLLSCLRRLGKV